MWCGLTENIIKRKMVRRSQDGIKHKTFRLEAAKIMLGLRPLKTKVLVHVFVWQAITNINETIILKLAKINMVLVSLVWPELTVLIVDIFPWAHVELTKVLMGALPFFVLFFLKVTNKWRADPGLTGVDIFGGQKLIFYIYLGPCGAHQASKISICKHSLHKNSTFL